MGRRRPATSLRCGKARTSRTGACSRRAAPARGLCGLAGPPRLPAHPAWRSARYAAPQACGGAQRGGARHGSSPDGIGGGSPGGDSGCAGGDSGCARGGAGKGSCSGGCGGGFNGCGLRHGNRGRGR
eukprot:1071072-Heterocapsa_arctica.AAC.1